ncbi:MAG: cobyrinic acid a,c-diamide synthase, partial [Eubacterium sp.]|nr:cobyrinic acid a,c-diamide synthase [Eubacterium sp.]
SLISDDFDDVVIDGEAGIEQINRRVMEKVTHLILVSDASKKGTQVINTIKEVADRLVMYEKLGAIINRLPSRDLISHIDTNGIPVLSYIENDSNLALYDIEARSILELPDDSEVVVGVREALEKTDLIQRR